MTSVNVSVLALAEKYAKEVFEMSFPLSMDALKSEFRRLAKKFHTDTSRDANTKSQFIKLKEAYDYLVKLHDGDYHDHVFGNAGDSVSHDLRTIDGTSLYHLGLGLGPMKNGRDCERCQHKGYTEEPDGFYSATSGYCTRCDYSGFVRDYGMCGPCAGSGMFRQRSGRLVPCRACYGSGLRRSAPYTCPDCHGKKFIREQPRRIQYVKCHECNGTGEIELFSPLFPKGRIINKVSIR